MRHVSYIDQAEQIKFRKSDMTILRCRDTVKLSTQRHGLRVDIWTQINYQFNCTDKLSTLRSAYIIDLRTQNIINTATQFK